jgi:DNA (cytosine-5)-methyltransferase 1
MVNGALTFGSVCDGIGCGHLAFERSGFSCSWSAEIEPFPCAVLAQMFPGVPNIGDMRKAAGMIGAGEIAAPDVFIGGTPCQAFSVAGKREGLKDERGNLSLEFCRIADAIDDVRRGDGKPPCVVLWENVPGVLSDKGNAFGCFLGELSGSGCVLQPPGEGWANAGCVFGPVRTVAWRTLDSQYFGVAQRRARVFVVARAGDGARPEEVLFEREGVRRDSAPRREAVEGVAPTLDVRAGRSGETSFHTSGG